MEYTVPFVSRYIANIMESYIAVLLISWNHISRYIANIMESYIAVLLISWNHISRYIANIEVSLISYDTDNIIVSLI